MVKVDDASRSPGLTAGRVAVPDQTPSWHLLVAGQEVGPLSVEDLMGRAGASLLTRRNYVWRDGMQGWERLEKVPELARVLELIPPSPPSQPATAPNAGPAERGDHPEADSTKGTARTTQASGDGRASAAALQAEDRRLAEEARLAAEMDAVAAAPRVDGASGSPAPAEDEEEAAEREFLESIGKGSPRSGAQPAVPAQSAAARPAPLSPARLPGLRPSPSAEVSADEETRPVALARPAGEKRDSGPAPKLFGARPPPSRPAAALPPPERIRVEPDPPSRPSIKQETKRPAAPSQPQTKPGSQPAMKALSPQGDAAAGTALALRSKDVPEEKPRPSDVPLGKETTEQVLSWDRSKSASTGPTKGQAAQDPDEAARLALAALEDPAFNVPERTSGSPSRRGPIVAIVVVVLAAVVGYVVLHKPPPPPAQLASHRRAAPDGKSTGADPARVAKTPPVDTKAGAGAVGEPAKDGKSTGAVAARAVSATLAADAGSVAAPVKDGKSTGADGGTSVAIPVESKPDAGSVAAPAKEPAKEGKPAGPEAARATNTNPPESAPDAGRKAAP